MKKRILIAIPTAKYIEADTFKCVFDAARHVDPNLYEVHFQTFFGYNIAQIRNLIADWVFKSYDYLFSVDSDVTFPDYTLSKFLEADKDIISGVYRQRTEEQNLEIYDLNYQRIESISTNQELIEIGACGMGCALIKKRVFLDIPYPQYEYHNALDHNQTFSEDIDFCIKARNTGKKIYADTQLLCGHIGTRYFNVEVEDKEPELLVETADPVIQRFRELRENNTIPESHVRGLERLKNECNFQPNTILDVGACVLHWHDHAKNIWPDANIIPIEAMSEVTRLYDEAGIRNYATGTLVANQDGLAIQFYKNVYHPGGNSFLRENPLYSPGAEELFPESSKTLIESKTIDSIIKQCQWPQPDFIKMDIQGAEYAALQGAREALSHAQWVLLELQHVDYNMGAPKASEVIDFMFTQGFILHDVFGGSELGVDKDYLFKRL